MSKVNKQYVQKAHEILKAQGHELPLGHLYEMFSKLGGFKDWNTAKASDVKFATVFTPLHESELEIISTMIESQKRADAHNRKLKLVRLTAEGKAWVKFDASYFAKEGVEITDAFIENAKKVFLKEINEWEAKAPADVEHITVQMETAYGYHELEPSDVEAEVEDNAKHVDFKNGVGDFHLPSLEDMGKIAEGLYKRQILLDEGIRTLPEVEGGSIKETTSI